MDFKLQSLILIILILGSLAITQLNSPATSEAISSFEENDNQVQATSSDLLGYQGASVSEINTVKKSPVRKWDVLDPKVTADVALVHSLDDRFPLFYTNTHEPHVLASLTKLLTAVIVMEDIGLNKKITISQDVVDTQGFAGNLTSGEVYDARALLKLMLLTSSNDSAAAFEEYLGGKEEFVKIANKKMDKIGMNETVLNDGSGLSDFNMGTASDFLKLSKYILENHPSIFTWTRNYELLIQPLNSAESRTELNINSLVDERNYLGGKTGTSQAAGENLIALFNSNNRRILVILMGSEQRDKDALDLLNWVDKAYNF